MNIVTLKSHSANLHVCMIGTSLKSTDPALFLPLIAWV